METCPTFSTAGVAGKVVAMIRRTLLGLLLVATACTAGGCFEQFDKSYSNSSDPQASDAQEGGPTLETPAESHAIRDTADRPSNAAPAPSGPQRSPDLSIHLSMGVALAQTLPTGTEMGFSVDYQVQRGWPQPTTDYFWVIERARGAPFRTPVRLRHGGDNLATFVPWRQSDGPFESHLEDASGKRISQSLLMR